MFRVRCSIFNFAPTGGFAKQRNIQEHPIRIDLALNIVLASLDNKEIDRVERSAGSHRHTSRWRLEVFHDNQIDSDQAMREIEHYMTLLCCVYRGSPKAVVNIDKYVDGTWKKVANCGFISGSERYFSMPFSRIPRWGELTENFPIDINKNLGISLNYFREAVAERRDGKLNRAMLSAAIAFESLLGVDVKTELTFRLSQRGALLVASGDHAFEVSAVLKKLYSVRSKLIHEGKNVDRESVTRIEQFLMKAIPSMAALTLKSSSIDGAIRILDLAPYREDRILSEVKSAGHLQEWWSSVDLAKIYEWDTTRN